MDPPPKSRRRSIVRDFGANLVLAPLRGARAVAKREMLNRPTKQTPKHYVLLTVVTVSCDHESMAVRMVMVVIMIVMVMVMIVMMVMIVIPMIVIVVVMVLPPPVTRRIVRMVVAPWLGFCGCYLHAE